MYFVMHPTYTLRVVVKDKPRENVVHVESMGTIDTQMGRGERRFNNGLDGDKTGCDEVLKAVRDALAKADLGQVSVYLDKYEHA